MIWKSFFDVSMLNNIIKKYLKSFNKHKSAGSYNHLFCMAIYMWCLV